jgi:ferritin-like metal-binding protein YciE
MAKTKTTLESLAQSIAKMDLQMRKGFAKHGKEISDLTSTVQHVVTSVGKIEDKIGKLEEKMPTKYDLRDVEKRLGNRIDGLKVQVEGMQNTFDADAMRRTDLHLPRRLHELEEKVFGHSKHR